MDGSNDNLFNFITEILNKKLYFHIKFYKNVVELLYISSKIGNRSTWF